MSRNQNIITDTYSPFMSALDILNQTTLDEHLSLSDIEFTC